MFLILRLECTIKNQRVIMHADNIICILRKSSPQYNLFTLSSFLHVYYLHGLTRKPNMIIDARADNAFYSIYRTHNAVRSLNKNSAAYKERYIGMHAMSRQTEDDGWSWCSTSLIVLRPQWTARNTACKHLHLPCTQRTLSEVHQGHSSVVVIGCHAMRKVAVWRHMTSF